MGTGICCTRKTLVKDKDLIIENGQAARLQLAGDSSELEAAFNSLYGKLEFPNTTIKSKWEQLPRFHYEEFKGKISLELVEKKISVQGEAYYGFM